MSLQVWLPLNGNVNNQGLSGITMTGSPNSWGTSGKISKCATFTGSTSNVIYNNTTDFNYIDNFSYCVWINQNYTGTATQWAFTNGRADYGGYGYGIQISNTSTISCRFGTKSVSVACPANEWHHIAVTISGTTMKIYKDGVLNSTNTTATLPTYSDGNGLGLGGFHYTGNIYPYYGSMNDFRIYDHCLSAKEVSEIAKGLVLHYPLNNGGFGAPNLLPKTDIDNYNADLWISNGAKFEVSNTTLFLDGSKTIRIYDGSSGIRINGTYSVELKPDTYYTYSAWLKSNDNIDISHNSPLHLWLASSKGGTAHLEINVSYSGVYKQNEWFKVIRTFKTPEKSLYPNTYVTAFIYGIPSTEVYLARPKLEEGSVATPWVPNSADILYFAMGLNSTTEYDCSGLSNNGTRSGMLTYSVDSARYNGSTAFDGSQFIAAGRTAMVTDAITVSWWGYMNDWSSYQRAISCTESGGWNFEPNNGYMSIPMYINGAYIHAKDTSPLSSYSSGWHHFVGTYNGYQLCIYVDGVLKSSTTATTVKYPITYNSTNGIFIGAEAGGNTTTPAGNYFVGKLSDIRIYATALSADDIKQLYSSPISIDKSGNLYAYEFKEV